MQPPSKAKGFKKRKAPVVEGSSRVKQKEMKRQRQASRPNADIVLQAKKVWAKLRVKEVPNAERQSLVTELMTMMESKLFELSSKHDASRIVQSMVQYGSVTQRTQIVSELQGHVVVLSKAQFGHFLVKKMIKYGSKSDRSLIVQAITGQVVQLATNAIAGPVLECLFEHITPAQVTDLSLEFYGKEFVFFKLQGVRNLKAILAKDASLERRILPHMASVLNRMTDKELLHLAFVQKLMWEYLSFASEAEIQFLLPNLRDAAVALLSTLPGAKVVALSLSKGNVKDRKRIIRALKGKVLEAWNHPSGYLVLMRLLDVVDDTVLVQKSILAEVTAHLLEVALHEKGSKVLLQLLHPHCKRYLDPQEQVLLAPPMITQNDQQIVNYKKEPATRREELLRGWTQPLQELCATHAAELMRSKSGSSVLIEVMQQDVGTAATSEAILAAIREDQSLCEDAVAHFCIQKLVAMNAHGFGVQLAEAAKEDLWKWVSTKRGAFVVLALLRLELATKDSTLLQSLLKARLTELKDLTENPGAKLIVELL